jgi:hypothetical protein
MSGIGRGNKPGNKHSPRDQAGAVIDDDLTRKLGDAGIDLGAMGSSGASGPT